MYKSTTNLQAVATILNAQYSLVSRTTLGSLVSSSQAHYLLTDALVEVLRGITGPEHDAAMLLCDLHYKRVARGLLQPCESRAA